MLATRCACGFTELDDEQILDHLALVFTPDDSVGNDGRVHEELSGRACACGFAGITSEGLESHFLESFRPADGRGRDGRWHGPATPRERIPAAPLDSDTRGELFLPGSRPSGPSRSAGT